MISELKITKQQLEKSVNAEIITAKQAELLWQFLASDSQHIPRFQAGHVLYYLGGFISILAVTLLIGESWSSLVGLPLLLLSIVFFVIGILLTNFFRNKNLVLPAGIMAAFSLVVVPLIVYNTQFLLHFLPKNFSEYQNFYYRINLYWLPMEITSLFVGSLLYFHYRFNFILFPLSMLLWYMSMDLYQLLFKLNDFNLFDRSWFSLLFSLIELSFLIRIDYTLPKESQDKLFWLYVFSVITFWSSLSCIFINNNSTAKSMHFSYLLVNLLMLCVGVVLQRRVFAIFAALGIYFYLSYLANGSILFPFALIAVGLIIIFIAVKWNKIELRLIVKYNRFLPKRFRNKSYEPF